ncbi:formin-J-like [Eupeodes corollae]|uniref:formin-J-like n=1 Tax=Eupeodes corollae TaxID=290404 RepID=UPI002492393E|nr:formin-J-like [Eupeodes corollae]
MLVNDDEYLKQHFRTSRRTFDELKDLEMQDTKFSLMEVECGFFCGRHFHKNCIDLSDDIHKSLINRNLFWKCNSCVNINLSTFINNFHDLSLSVREIKNDLSALKLVFSNNSPPRKTAKKNSKSAERGNDSSSLTNFNIEPNTKNIPPPPLNISEESEIAKSVTKSSASTSEHNSIISEQPGVFKNTTEWTEVQSKKKKNSNSTNTKKIIGTDSSATLCALADYTWIHLSKFSRDTKPEDIINHISEKTNISPNHFKCYALVKKDTDTSKLKFVTFKLSVPASKYSIIMDSCLWPCFVQIKKFVSRESSNNNKNKELSLQTSSSLNISTSQTPPPPPPLPTLPPQPLPLPTPPTTQQQLQQPALN